MTKLFTGLCIGGPLAGVTIKGSADGYECVKLGDDVTIVESWAGRPKVMTPNERHVYRRYPVADRSFFVHEKLSLEAALDALVDAYTASCQGAMPLPDAAAPAPPPKGGRTFPPGFIPWGGGLRPMLGDTDVLVIFEGNYGPLPSARDMAHRFDWSHANGPATRKIVAYKPTPTGAPFLKQGCYYIDEAGDVQGPMATDGMEWFVRRMTLPVFSWNVLGLSTRGGAPRLLCEAELHR